MLLVRQVFQAKYGPGNERVALFQEFNARMRDAGDLSPQIRILTDPSGPFVTAVTETEVENFAAWESGFREAMERPWTEEWFSPMMPLVESCSREFYTTVE